MGISHCAIVNTCPGASLVAVCDTTPYVLDVLNKYTGIPCYSDYRQLLDEAKPDAVFVVTPTRYHGEVVRAALDRDMHVFCEKPFCLSVAEGQALAELAERKRLVNQVGYHYRFVGSFQEMKRLVAAGVLGRIHHIRAEAYGPVVVRPEGRTWRASRREGGGCLYDYACHAIDLVHYLVGRPEAVGGTVLNRIFSREVEDEVYATLYFADRSTGSIAANWSDESQRRMSTTVTLWGSKGTMTADRQELHVYLREVSPDTPGLSRGWNTRYTTDLTKDVWYYLRGEEYSAQIDHFIRCIESGRSETESTFQSAVEVDLVVDMLTRDASSKHPQVLATDANARPTARRRWLG